MDRACNFFVKKNVVHGLCDIGVYANGKFAHISCALVCVEYLFQTLLVIPVAVYDFPVFEGQAYIFKGKAVVFGGGIIGNHTVDGIAHRCGINLAVGDIAAAGTLDGRNILDGEGNIRTPCHQTHAVCFIHQFHQMLHGITHFAVIQIAYIKIEILEILQRGLGGLSHGICGVAQYHPFCMWHTNLMMHRVIIQTVLDIDFFCRHVILLCQVVLPTHADEGIHLLHQAAVHLCHDFLLFLCCAQKQLPFQRVCHHFYKGNRTHPVGLLDNLLHQRQRMHAVAGNPDLFALFQFAGKMHEVIC